MSSTWILSKFWSLYCVNTRGVLVKPHSFWYMCASNNPRQSINACFALCKGHFDTVEFTEFFTFVFLLLTMLIKPWFLFTFASCTSLLLSGVAGYNQIIDIGTLLSNKLTKLLERWKCYWLPFLILWRSGDPLPL